MISFLLDKYLQGARFEDNVKLDAICARERDNKKTIKAIKTIKNNQNNKKKLDVICARERDNEKTKEAIKNNKKNNKKTIKNNKKTGCNLCKGERQYPGKRLLWKALEEGT